MNKTETTSTVLLKHHLGKRLPVMCVDKSHGRSGTTKKLGK